MIQIIDARSPEGLKEVFDKFMSQSPGWSILEENPHVPFPKQLAVRTNRKIQVLEIFPISGVKTIITK